MITHLDPIRGSENGNLQQLKQCITENRSLESKEGVTKLLGEPRPRSKFFMANQYSSQTSLYGIIRQCHVLHHAKKKTKQKQAIIGSVHQSFRPNMAKIQSHNIKETVQWYITKSSLTSYESILTSYQYFGGTGAPRTTISTFYKVL